MDKWQILKKVKFNGPNETLDLKPVKTWDFSGDEMKNEIDKCNCGRLKRTHELKCGECSFTLAVTTHRCEKHNKLWSTGSSCPDCLQDAWIKTVPEFTAKPEQSSARHNTGKVQVREIDPDFIKGLGEVLTASREKYDEGNWMKETKFSTPYESCMRHMMKFWNGEEFDEETGKHHLLHAATNIMFLYYHTDSGKGIDDRLFKKDKK